MDRIRQQLGMELLKLMSLSKLLNRILATAKKVNSPTQAHCFPNRQVLRTQAPDIRPRTGPENVTKNV